MPSNVLITSKSNFQQYEKHSLFRDFAWHVVDDQCSMLRFNREKDQQIWALGGGQVIDTAKILSEDRPIIAIPTTAAGACMTDWAVVWTQKEKRNVKTKRPMLMELYRYMTIKLPAEVKEATYYDCLCHILDSRASIKSTPESLAYCQIATSFLNRWKSSRDTSDLIDAGNYAGRAIAITGTNYYHALSYVLTLDHGLSHGMALKAALEKDKKFNWNKIIQKAKEYEKFFEVGA